MENNQFNAAVEAWVKMQKREQNFRIMKFFLIAIFVCASLGFTLYKDKDQFLPADEPYVSLVRIDGMIAPGSIADATKIGNSLRLAFKDEDARGVVIQINSPGGTPAQSVAIYREIMRLKAESNVPVVVVAEDSLTSGAYLAAMAADKIYALPSSTVGSIGVVMESIAYAGLAEKFGVEKRTYTAGENKRRFDPFSAETEADRQKAEEILAQIHNQFIDIVRSGRQNMLKAEEEVLFSGDFWTGQQAMEYGLIDGFGTLFEVMKNEFGVEAFRQFRTRSSFADVMQALGG